MFHRLSYNNWEWDDRSIYISETGNIIESTGVKEIDDVNNKGNKIIYYPNTKTSVIT